MTAYFLSKAYEIRVKKSQDQSPFPFELVETSVFSLPPPIEIVKLTALRTDEKDMRIAKIKIPIEIPLRLEKDNCAPNWDQRFGAFAFFDDKMI